MEHKINEAGQIMIKVGDDWMPMPDHLVKRLLAAESPVDLTPPVVPSGMVPVAAFPADTFPGSDDPPIRTRPVVNPQLSLFRKKAGCEPAEYIERLVEGSILERSERVTAMYKLACQLCNRPENPLELI